MSLDAGVAADVHDGPGARRGDARGAAVYSYPPLFAPPDHRSVARLDRVPKRAHSGTEVA